MSKILKNTTGSDIKITTLGLTIEASSQITVEVVDYVSLASPDAIGEVTPFINSGDIVVNDGVCDLPSVDGIRFLSFPDIAFDVEFYSEPNRSNGFSSMNVQDAIEEANIFGSEYHYAESLTESSTTVGSYQEKLKLTTGSIPAGDYKITWSAEVKTSDKDMRYQCQLDDTIKINVGDHSDWDDGVTDDSYYIPVGGFAKVTLTSGVHTIDIDYHDQGGGTAYIEEARIEIYRVS
jgi:hypothetical protein